MEEDHSHSSRSRLQAAGPGNIVGSSQVLNSSSDIGNSCESETNHQRVGLREQSEVMKDAFSLACNCILDLSSMPKYHNSAGSDQSEHKSSVDCIDQSHCRGVT